MGWVRWGGGRIGRERPTTSAAVLDHLVYFVRGEVAAEHIL